MRTRTSARNAVFGAALLTLIAMIYSAATPFARGDEQGPAKKQSGCVEYWGEARYIVNGYHHYVMLESRCPKVVACEVWTNVNPERQRVELEPNARGEVLTFRESPARVFTPFADCTK